MLIRRTISGLKEEHTGMWSKVYKWTTGLVVLGAMSCACWAQVTAPSVASTEATKVNVEQKKAVFDYQLAPGDVIAVEVFDEPELSKEYTVDESGSISFSLIGELSVINLRTKQVERLIKKRLEEGYLVNPKLSVTVKSYRAVYINGQVRSPSGYPFVPGMTVRKLISIAGGFTERASRSRIFIIADNAAANERPKKVKLDATVRPGDIISVEESFF